MYERVQKRIEQLPRGRHRIPREAVRENQRQRLLAGMAKALAEHGYARTTVEHVIENAGMSRKTFYEFFDDKEDCLLAAYDDASARLWTAGSKAAAGAGGWPEQVHAAIAAALGFLAAEPFTARLFTLEARASGAAMAARQHANAERAAALLRAGREGRPEATRLPEATEATLVDNVAAIAGAHILSGATGLLPGLAPQLSAYVLASYLGPEEMATATAHARRGRHPPHLFRRRLAPQGENLARPEL